MIFETYPKRRAPKNHEVWRYSDLQISHHDPIGDQNDDWSDPPVYCICQTVPSPESVGTVQTKCSITRQCWNSTKPTVPSPGSVGTVQTQLFHHQAVLEQYKTNCSNTFQNHFQKYDFALGILFALSTAKIVCPAWPWAHGRSCKLM